MAVDFNINKSCAHFQMAEFSIGVSSNSFFLKIFYTLVLEINKLVISLGSLMHFLFKIERQKLTS